MENKLPEMKVEKKIEVIADRDGFYGNRRIKAGMKFEIAKFEDIGTWMRCVDKKTEEKRLKFFADKKAKSKAKA